MQMKRILAKVLIVVMIFTMTPFLQTEIYAAKKVKLNKTKITIEAGRKKKLKVKNKPKGIKVRWISRNKAVAKVTKKGVVKAKKPGKTVIIAKVGSKKLRCRVKVKRVQREVPATTKVFQEMKEIEVTTTKVIETTKPETETDPKEQTTNNQMTQPQQTTTENPVTQSQPTTQTQTTTSANPVTQSQPTTQTQTTTSANQTTQSMQTTQSQEVTTESSGRVWTEVFASDGKLFYADADNVTIVSRQKPDWAKEFGVYAYTTTAISYVTLNGVNATDTQVKIQGSGVLVYESAIPKQEIKVDYHLGDGTVVASIHYKNTAGTSELPTGNTSQTTTQSEQTTTQSGQTTTQSGQTTQSPEVTTKTDGTFTTDTSIDKPFGEVVNNPENGMISVVWGAGNPNCYNVYIDGVRKKTKVSAALFTFPVQTEGEHTVSITHVNPTANTESEPVTVKIYVTGTAPEETTAIVQEDMPQIDESIEKQEGKIVLQLNNKTNSRYDDSQIYWLIVGRNPDGGAISYVDADGNLVKASAADNDSTINGRSYSGKIVHTLKDCRSVQIPAITSGRLYISYGEPVYITFNGTGQDVGYAGPDINNTGDANYNTMFEYLEFTTESVNGGILFHGNTTRVDFFSFPMVTRLTDEYGGYDICVGDIGTRAEIFASYKDTVSDKFDTLVTTPRIMCPAKLTFGEGKPYGDYFDDYINRFWNKYSNEDLVIGSEAGNFTGRVSGGRLVLTDSNGTYYIEKPSTQDVLEGRGAFNRISNENTNNANGRRCELAIEAQLCAAFNRGVAMEPEKWTQAETYYKSGEIYNEYAAFFHDHAVGGRAYGFCYDDVCDQSTLVVCNNAAGWTIDLKW